MSADFKCDICGAIFERKEQLGEHHARHNIGAAGLARITLPAPLLKWVGGKSQILREVLALFPQKMNGYHEPFLGGGSVLLAFLECRARGLIETQGRVMASDVNPNLINFYRNVQTNAAILVAEAAKLANEFLACAISGTLNRKPATITEARTSRESYYYWIRARFNALSADERASPAASALLLFLNKTCFRGVYREGPRGYNVPYGNYKKPAIFDEAHIMWISSLIKDVEFSCSTFSDAIERAHPGDFMYLDPPYASEDESTFTSYTLGGFQRDDHKKLFEMCAHLSERNIMMLMSNAATKLVTDAFPAPEFRMKVISCRRAIHSKKPNARANEVLVTN